MSVLVWIEQSKSGVVANSWEVLGAGRKVADALGTSLVAAVIGGDTAAAAAEASTYGADTVLTLSSPALADYRLSGYAAALKKAVAEPPLRNMATNSFSRQKAISEPRRGIRVSRPMK